MDWLSWLAGALTGFPLGMAYLGWVNRRIEGRGLMGWPRDTWDDEA